MLHLGGFATFIIDIHIHICMYYREAKGFKDVNIILHETKKKAKAM